MSIIALGAMDEVAGGDEGVDATRWPKLRHDNEKSSFGSLKFVAWVAGDRLGVKFDVG
jgi:hypothetical protein